MSPPGRAPATEAATVLEWLGHATVLVTASDGTRVLFDPYEPMGFDGRIAHAPIRRTVDVVAITHQHRDHCHVTPEMGSPHLVEGPRELGALRFRAVSAFHDREQGARMGLVQLFALEVDGRRIVHLGDIGVPPDAGQVRLLGRPDVLLLPVGGTYTIDAAAAAETVRRLAPRIAVPIHFRNEKCTLPMTGLEPFLEEVRRRGWPIEETGGSTMTLSPGGALPRDIRIRVLQPSH